MLLIIYLGFGSRQNSIDLPTNYKRVTFDAPAGQALVYLVFQHLRFAVPLLSPAKRWSLTPPFHPYHLWSGGLFSVALSVSLAAAFLLGSRLLCVARTFLFASAKR